MAEFSSCYFCGTALDAQIDPYPVVPEDAVSGDRPTVDLCPVCRRKLSKILDVALSAAEGAERTATPLAAGPDPSPLSADHEDPTADLGSEGDESEGPAYAVEPGGEATAVEDGEDERSESSKKSSGERSRDATDGSVSESRTASEASRERSDPRDSEGERSEPSKDVSGTDADTADGAVANGEEPETSHEGAASDTADGSEKSESEPVTDDTESATEGAETAQDTETGGSDGDGESDQPSILSTPAAQKVIKLLQNREFPVEREEIEVVASNAYEIPHRDSADVIDALVGEGYVDERKGKLVRPEE